ncbi:MAG TPA: hypothetical protein VFT61_08565 [Sphingomicrobium sp.]|nr:hypothetical protein [Sphingomicrobium sp.]
MDFDEFRKHFRLGDWRQENEYRRECDRLIVLHAIEAGVPVENLIRYWRVAARYCDMSYHDRANFKQRIYYVRRVANFWHLLDIEEQEQFRSGAILPYRAASVVTKRLSSKG